MPDTTASLDIGQVVYHFARPYYVTAMRREPAASSHKITYQISQDLPTFPGGWKRGPWGNVNQWFEREQLQTEDEFHGVNLARIEDEANAYERTLTHIPIISLVGEEIEKYVLNDDGLYPWDGITIPQPTDATALIDATATIWDDPGFTIDDQEDDGQAHDGTVQAATVLHDATAVDHSESSYLIDSTEFMFATSVTVFDGTTTVVTNPTLVDWTQLGRYIITYEVWDNQRIAAYPVTRMIEIHPPYEAPPRNC